MELFNILTYDKVKVENILDIGDVFIPICELSVNRDAGDYEFGMSYTFAFADINDSFEVRWSLDGTNWNVFRHENGDKSDVQPFTYIFPRDGYTGGLTTFYLEARKDTGGAQLDCNYADIWFKRMG